MVIFLAFSDAEEIGFEINLIFRNCVLWEDRSNELDFDLLSFCSEYKFLIVYVILYIRVNLYFHLNFKILLTRDVFYNFQNNKDKV